MEPEVQQALEKDRLIDITTTGRKTGQSWRKEIGFHLIDGRLYLSGTPGPRSWYANMIANPDFTVHLKQSVQRDLHVRAKPIQGKTAKRAVMAKIGERLRARRPIDVEEWVEGSPLVEVEFLT
ncbi:MAG: DUF385 domain-containing protein [Dehalococcoidia bacterium]|nr:DUF385 domain-containing protein [Dehalococcoidia bacterium]